MPRFKLNLRIKIKVLFLHFDIHKCRSKYEKDLGGILVDDKF